MATKKSVITAVVAIIHLACGEKILSVTRRFEGDEFTIDNCNKFPESMTLPSNSECTFLSVHDPEVGGRGRCVCRCNADAPIFREDTMQCVAYLKECKPPRKAKTFEKTTPDIKQNNFVPLNQNEVTIHPSNDLYLVDDVVPSSICTMAKVNFLTQSGFQNVQLTHFNKILKALPTTKKLILLSYDSKNSSPLKIFSGHIMAMEILCKSHLSGIQHFCYTLRVQGSISINNIDQSFDKNASKKISTNQLVFIAMGFLITSLSVTYICASCFYLKMRKRLEQPEATLNNLNDVEKGQNDKTNETTKNQKNRKFWILKNNNLESKSEKSQEETDEDDEIYSTASIEEELEGRRQRLERLKKLKEANAALFAEHDDYHDYDIPYEAISASLDLDIVDSPSDFGKNNFTQPESLNLPDNFTKHPRPRRKLFFSPSYFEPEMLQKPPPSAVEFLTNVRQMMGIAKQKIQMKVFQPTLIDIPEIYEKLSSLSCSRGNKTKNSDSQKLNRKNRNTEVIKGKVGEKSIYGRLENFDSDNPDGYDKIENYTKMNKTLNQYYNIAILKCTSESEEDKLIERLRNNNTSHKNLSKINKNLNIPSGTLPQYDKEVSITQSIENKKSVNSATNYSSNNNTYFKINNKLAEIEKGIDMNPEFPKVSKNNSFEKNRKIISVTRNKSFKENKEIIKASVENIRQELHTKIKSSVTRIQSFKKAKIGTEHQNQERQLSLPVTTTISSVEGQKLKVHRWLDSIENATELENKTSQRQLELSTKDEYVLPQIEECTFNNSVAANDSVRSSVTNRSAISDLRKPHDENYACQQDKENEFYTFDVNTRTVNKDTKIYSNKRQSKTSTLLRKLSFNNNLKSTVASASHKISFRNDNSSKHLSQTTQKPTEDHHYEEMQNAPILTFDFADQSQSENFSNSKNCQPNSNISLSSGADYSVKNLRDNFLSIDIYDDLINGANAKSSPKIKVKRKDSFIQDSLERPKVMKKLPVVQYKDCVTSVDIPCIQFENSGNIEPFRNSDQDKTDLELNLSQNLLNNFFKSNNPVRRSKTLKTFKDYKKIKFGNLKSNDSSKLTFFGEGISLKYSSPSKFRNKPHNDVNVSETDNENFKSLIISSFADQQRIKYSNSFSPLDINQRAKLLFNNQTLKSLNFSQDRNIQQVINQGDEKNLNLPMDSNETKYNSSINSQIASVVNDDVENHKIIKQDADKSVKDIILDDAKLDSKNLTNLEEINPTVLRIKFEENRTFFENKSIQQTIEEISKTSVSRNNSKKLKESNNYTEIKHLKSEFKNLLSRSNSKLKDRKFLSSHSDRKVNKSPNTKSYKKSESFHTDRKIHANNKNESKTTTNVNGWFAFTANRDKNEANSEKIEVQCTITERKDSALTKDKNSLKNKSNKDSFNSCASKNQTDVNVCNGETVNSVISGHETADNFETESIYDWPRHQHIPVHGSTNILKKTKSISHKNSFKQKTEKFLNRSISLQKMHQDSFTTNGKRCAKEKMLNNNNLKFSVYTNNSFSIES